VPSFQTTRLVRHSPEAMFDLVADIERYPEFLPLCEGLRVIRRGMGEGGHEVLVAEMQVGYKAIKESFTTKVMLDRPSLRILVEYIDGPFRYLQNRWEFKPAEGGAAVEFFIDYEFRSRMLGMLMGTMFERAFRMFTTAFENRADMIYGRPGAVRA
jgi:coenzyme Q-binding protein COQ10